ncbi:MAG: hypothetical protein HYS12_00910 [Planctomycetes bacterium]|nr:hypothetical protein [Planctomycetota bacterium]
MDAARAIYKLHGSAGRLAAYYPSAKHSFPPDARKKAYKFLDQHLKK